MQTTHARSRRHRHHGPVASIGAVAIALVALASGAMRCTASGAPSFPEPESLVGIGPAFPKVGRPLAFREVLSGPEILDIQEQSAALERVVAWDLGRRRVAGGSAPERLFTAFWWGEPLATLGVRPLLGRTFLAEELAGRAKVAMLSERVWRRLFAGDPGVIGKTVQVEDEAHTLIGILPAAVTVHDTDLWLPMWAPATGLPRERRQFQILARLRPGTTLAALEVELSEIARRIEDAHVATRPEYAGWRLEARTWEDIVAEHSSAR